MAQKRRARKTTRPRKPRKAADATGEEPQTFGRIAPRLVVKFQDDIRFPRNRKPETVLRVDGIAPWGKLVRKHPGLSLSRVFKSVTSKQLARLVKRAKRNAPRYVPPNFGNYFFVDGPPDMRPLAILRALLRWDCVQTAYAQRVTPSAFPADPPDDPDFLASRQKYLDPGDLGIDAKYAWLLPGGAGQGRRLIVVDLGFSHSSTTRVLTHPDLIGHAAQMLGTGDSDSTWEYHGNAAVGIPCADTDNATGVAGIAPSASVDVVPWGEMVITDPSAPEFVPGYDPYVRPNIEDAIALAAVQNPQPDVILIEAEASRIEPGSLGFAVALNTLGLPWEGLPWENGLPIEVHDANFAAIQLATLAGIVVVEPAGNGTHDLDTFEDYDGLKVLARDPLGTGVSGLGYRDSGAVVVGGGEAATPHGRTGSSSFGSRVDCYAWGQSVYNCFTLNTPYGPMSGTSAASAIVAGAALSVQGMAIAVQGMAKSATTIRHLLSTYGTESANPPVDRIGKMPDLRKIARGELNIAPDVYLRDFVGDPGDPHGSNASLSPDMHVSLTDHPVPQVALGPGTPSENDPWAGSTVVAGSTNYVYARVKNRGGVDEPNVYVHLYWTPGATLGWPFLWNSLGTATLPNVPAVNQLVVADPLVWNVPASFPHTTVCLVGIVDSVRDPPSGISLMAGMTEFVAYIRSSNNAAWRNVNVAQWGPSTVPNFPGLGVRLPFLFPAPPGAPEPVELRLDLRLPLGSRAFLAAPMPFVLMLGTPPDYTYQDPVYGEVGFIEVPHHAVTHFSAVTLAPMLEVPMEIIVQNAQPGTDGFASAHQVWNGIQVGAFSWKIEPAGLIPSRTGPA